MVTVASSAVLSVGLFWSVLGRQLETPTAAHDRIVIELARGILITQHSCSLEEALQLLVQAAKDNSLSVVEVAVEVVIGRGLD